MEAEIGVAGTHARECQDAQPCPRSQNWELPELGENTSLWCQPHKSSVFVVEALASFRPLFSVFFLTRLRSEDLFLITLTCPPNTRREKEGCHRPRNGAVFLWPCLDLGCHLSWDHSPPCPQAEAPVLPPRSEAACHRCSLPPVAQRLGPGPLHSLVQTRRGAPAAP